MKKLLARCVFSLVFIIGAGECAYSASVGIEELIDAFSKATDLQREQILQDNLGQEVSANAKVSNAGEYDFFDTTNDLKGTYYQVVTEPQKTKTNVAYQLIFLFKDKDEVKDIDKGQSIQKDGKIIRIIDERLQIALWVFCGELSETDKALIKKEVN